MSGNMCVTKYISILEVDFDRVFMTPPLWCIFPIYVYEKCFRKEFILKGMKF